MSASQDLAFSFTGWDYFIDYIVNGFSFFISHNEIFYGLCPITFFLLLLSSVSCICAITNALIILE